MPKPQLQNVAIRDERSEDIPAIHALTQAAFADRPFSQGHEGPIIDRLRADGDLAISLVAEHVGRIVGHIAISPVAIGGESGRLYGLGPVSADPDLRHRRIGTRLIEAALARLRETGARACVLVGDPGYYSRFGFRGGVGLTHAGLPTQVVQGLVWEGDMPEGEIAYAPAFGAERG